MKRIASTAVVATILFGTAVYYAVQARPAPEPTPPETETEPEPEPDPTPSPTTRQTIQGALTLEAATSQGYLPTGERETFYAAIDVTADDPDAAAPRPPLNVALVIDRSGSMRGDKIEHVRRAAHTIVDMLDRDDRLSIVSYQSNASVDLHPQPVDGSSIDRMHRTIDGIRAGGGTNIEAGMRRAKQALVGTKTRESVNRIVLLSDGKPTVGRTGTGALSRLAEGASDTGVSVTTMGVGVDYNEQLLTRMANVGGGNYYFIDAPDKVVSIFQKELGGLAETVAKSASLVIDLGDRVELEDVYGYPSDTSGGRVRVALSEFFAEQNKSVLLELRGRIDAPRPQSVLDIELSYQDLIADRPAHHSASLTAAASDDPAQIDGSIDRSVVSRVQQVEVATRIDDAMEAFKRGDKQEATEVLERSRKQVRQAKDEYDLPAKKMRAVDSKLQNVQREVSTHSASSGAGKTVIKRQRAESNKMMLDSKSLK